MLKIKFKQYGVFKKQINSSLNYLSKFFFNNDAGRIQNTLPTNKKAEKKPIANNNIINTNLINNLNTQNKISDPKIRILNNRRAQNFLKEDEESFRKKQEFLEKEKVDVSDLEDEMDLEDEDSFLNINKANAAANNNKNPRLKVTDLTEKSYVGKPPIESSGGKEIASVKQKKSNVAALAISNKEDEKNFKSNNYFTNNKY